MKIFLKYGTMEEDKARDMNLIQDCKDLNDKVHIYDSSRKIFRLLFFVTFIAVLTSITLISIFTTPSEPASIEFCGPSQCFNQGTCVTDGACWCTWNLFESDTQCESVSAVGVVGIVIIFLIGVYSMWSLRNWYYFTKEIKSLKKLIKVREEDYQRTLKEQGLEP